jgi:hypothetical protein
VQKTGGRVFPRCRIPRRAIGKVALCGGGSVSLQVIKILALPEKYAVSQVRHRYLGGPNATVPIHCDSRVYPWV